MKFLVRSAKEADLKDLKTLASQFSLLNLPPDEDILMAKIERSMASFHASDRKKSDCEYMFVIEDLERECVVGSSLILAKHGTPESPHTFFQVRKENRFSQDLGVGFIHQVLELGKDEDGPTEIGGLLIDRNYRRRPEKLGKRISLVRFLFMGMFPERFEKRVLCEFAPPLTREGRSEFWEAVGRRFTGLPYQEADQISQRHKEFIDALFPKQELFACLLDTKARQVMGQVSEATLPAKHLLEALGFRYLHEIDPFDGGPHYGVETMNISLVRDTQQAICAKKTDAIFQKQALVGRLADGKFLAVFSPISVSENSIQLPESAMKNLGVSIGDSVSYTCIER